MYSENDYSLAVGVCIKFSPAKTSKSEKLKKNKTITLSFFLSFQSKKKKERGRFRL